MRAKNDSEAPQGALRFLGYGARSVTGAGLGSLKDLSLSANGWGCDAGRAQSTGCDASNELVLPGVGGADTCFGDSGGPVFDLVPTPHGCAWRVTAITSRSVADGVSPCGSGGIYTRSDVVADFVNETVKEWEGTR
jgi:hypothetical protein